MVANLTAFDNLTSPLQVAAAANTTSDGYLFAFGLFAIYIVLFIVFKNYDTKAVFVGVSFICTVLAVLLWGADLISFKILIWPILGLFASILALLFWPD